MRNAKCPFCDSDKLNEFTFNEVSQFGRRYNQMIQCTECKAEHQKKMWNIRARENINTKKVKNTIQSLLLISLVLLGYFTSFKAGHDIGMMDSASRWPMIYAGTTGFSEIKGMNLEYPVALAKSTKHIEAILCGNR